MKARANAALSALAVLAVLYLAPALGFYIDLPAKTVRHTLGWAYLWATGGFEWLILCSVGGMLAASIYVYRLKLRLLLAEGYGDD